MKTTRKPGFSVFLCLMLCLRAGSAGVPGPDAAPVSDSIDSILVNQTVTVAGQEFHATFAALWSDKPSLTGYALAIRERPSARRGTTVEVEHGNQTVFRAYLPPSRAQIRALAEQAVAIVYEDAVAAQVQHLLRDDDLASDEL
jgi:curli production assembly/transport component CsgE